jgi:glycosyltransferase involved in cell wall biosynthesis
MASGVPCVVQNIPVMPEVTGGHALSIDYADRAAAAQALERGLTDERWRAQAIAEGLRHARSFSFERLAGERLHALFRVLGRSVPNSLKRFAPVFADSIA